MSDNGRYVQPVQKVSRAVFLWPFFFGVFGGIGACIWAWDKDRGTAKMCLLLGFVFAFMWFAILSLFALAAAPASSYDYYPA